MHNRRVPSVFFTQSPGDLTDQLRQGPICLQPATSSSQLATSLSGSLRACRTIRINADGSTVKPYPALIKFVQLSDGIAEGRFVFVFSRHFGLVAPRH